MQRCQSLSLLIVLVLLKFFSATAQGHLPKTSKNSFKGALSFLPEWEIAGSYTTLASPHSNRTDPLASPKEWITDNDGSMRGIMKEAVLFMEWWTLLGDPVESYLFKWKTSGYYEVMYEEDGKNVNKFVYRTQLEKYPDLLKWFDNIAPGNINFEIGFSMGKLSEKDYRDFREKKSLFSSLGASGFKMDYNRKVEGIQMLFERSERHPPFNVPVMANGWRDFMGVSSDVSDEKFGDLISLFRMAETVSINYFAITSIRWPIDGMIALAKKFDKYEKEEKRPSPEQLVSQADASPLKTMGDDFWNETDIPKGDVEIYMDPTNFKYGLRSKNKRTVTASIYNNIVQSSDKQHFFANTSDETIAYTKFGKEVARISGYYSYNSKSNQFMDQTGSEDTECIDYDILYYKTYTFSNNDFQRGSNYFSFQRQLYISVESYNDKRTSQEKDRDAREAKRFCIEAVEKARSSALSQGMKELND